MADLIVTFTRGRSLRHRSEDETNYPVAKGSAARTVALVIGPGNAVSSIEAEGDEQFVVVKAKAECWVAIGPDPVAGAAASDDSPPTAVTSWHLDADELREFDVAIGDKVAVTAV